MGARVAQFSSLAAFLLFLSNFFSIIQFVHQPTPPHNSLANQVGFAIPNDNDSTILVDLTKMGGEADARVPAQRSDVNFEKVNEAVALPLLDLPTGDTKEPDILVISMDQDENSQERRGKGRQKQKPMGFESNVVVDPPNFHFQKPRKGKKSKKCHVRYPTNQGITFNNLHWQVLEGVGWKIFLYSSFYDNRDVHRKIPYIRILGIATSREIKSQTFFCQLWFTEYQTAKVVKVKVHLLWPWIKYISNGQSVAVMLSCPLKGELKNLVPFAVSVVSKKCAVARNKLKVINPQGPQKPPSEFGVCVKGLDFPDVDTSLRLIEWIELLRLLGATKIHLYLYSVHPNAKKVLEYYEKQGMVEVGPLTLPGPFTNEPLRRHDYLIRRADLKRRLEFLPMNDCLYRNLRYKYLAFLDIDEVIIPLGVKTWGELIGSHLENKSRESIRTVGKKQKGRVSSYQVKQNGCFFHGIQRAWFDGIPKSMHMLQHVYKTRPKEGAKWIVGMKAFFVTSTVLAAFNHHPFLCLNGPCHKVRLNETLVQLSHYKSIDRHCNGPRNKSCNSLQCLQNTVIDKSIWRYREPLKIRFLETVTNIFKDHPPKQWTE